MKVPEIKAIFTDPYKSNTLPKIVIWQIISLFTDYYSLFTIYFLFILFPQISSVGYFVPTHSSQRTSVSHILSESYMDPTKWKPKLFGKNYIAKNMGRL